MRREDRRRGAARGQGSGVLGPRCGRATAGSASARPRTAPPSSRAAIADESAIGGVERPSTRRAAPARKPNVPVIVGLALLALLAVALVFLMNRG
jgi:hypothetical protein